MKADMLFVTFGERFECLYGKKAVTPNMHLHSHLKECIIDCGPVHAFWWFSSERFNGILGAIQVMEDRLRCSWCGNFLLNGLFVMQSFLLSSKIPSCLSLRRQEMTLFRVWMWRMPPLYLIVHFAYILGTSSGVILHFLVILAHSSSMH